MYATIVADPLPPFAMWTAFPSSDYYGGSAPCRAQRVSASLPAAVLAAQRGGQTRQVAMFMVSRSARRCPALLRQPRPGTPQTFPAASSPTSIARPEVASPFARETRTASRPIPPGSSQFHDYGGSTTGSLALHLPASFAGPGPSGSAGPFRPGQGCFPPSPAPPGRLPSTSTPLRRPSDAGLSPPSATRHFMAHLDDVKGIEHRDRVGQLVTSRVAIPAERVQRGVFDRHGDFRPLAP
jgi:hypothetical protein